MVFLHLFSLYGLQRLNRHKTSKQKLSRLMNNFVIFLKDVSYARNCRGIVSISFCNITSFIPIQSCINFSPRSCIDGRVVTMHDVCFTSSASLLTLMHPSLWNRVNLDSSDHMTFFHCSKVQYLCSLANWSLFSWLAVFLRLHSCLVPIPWVPFTLCVWKCSYFHY